MTRVNVWLPEDLAEQVKTLLPEVNLSAVLQDELRSRLECDHQHLACTRCAAKVDRDEWADELVSRFYRQALSVLEPLVNVRGTAEGAALILKRLAQRHNLSAADSPLPRPARAARRANRRTTAPMIELEVAG